MAPPVVGFSDLPTEALDEIARRAGPLDNIICAAVCRSWRRALKTARLRLLGRRPDRPHEMHVQSRWPRPSLVKVRPYYSDTARWSIQTPAKVDPARIIGCSHGWLVTVDDHTWVVSLFDPLTGRSFPLPPFAYGTDRQLRELREKFRFGRSMFQKAALAPGRRLGTCAVMLLHSDGRGLSYLRPGGSTWATVRPPRGMPHRYLDVIFHRGAFYTVSCYAELNAWVADGGGGLRTRRLTNPLREQVSAVLVESMSRDGILMVNSTDPPGYNYYHRQRQYTVRRYGERERRWLSVENLEEMMIEVGDEFSFCVPRSFDEFDNGDGPVKACRSYCFFPYVARLDPPL
ncbi:hypothetical protein ACQ4PT_044051 [Festuca glaucescens]